MKAKNLIILLSVVAVVLLSGCEPTSKLSRRQAYPELYRDTLVTVLVMPPINKTNKVEAKEYFFTTLSQPLCEKGYYVIPPYLSMAIFKNESAYDADLFIDRPMDKFAKYFNADVILFTVINRWEKMALGGSITVEVEYIAKSTKTNSVVYSRKGTMTVDTSVNASSGGGLAGALINMAATAINTAMTPHIKAARACNAFTFMDFPSGKYSPSCKTDSTLKAGLPEFKATVRTNQ